MDIEERHLLISKAIPVMLDVSDGAFAVMMEGILNAAIDDCESNRKNESWRITQEAIARMKGVKS